MAQLGTIGEKIDLLIKQGSTFGPYFVELTNPDETPVDLSGCIIRGKIKKTGLSVVTVEELNVTITDAVLGKFKFGLTDEETAVLPAGETLKDKASLYTWDMEIEDNAGNVLPLYFGDVRVFREVTNG